MHTPNGPTESNSSAGAASMLRPPFLSVTALLLALLMLLPALPAAAQTGEAVGRVISVVGQVTAIGPHGERRSLERRSRIHEGDTVVTGDGGRAQVRFKDKGLVDVKPDSRFTIERYRAKAAGDAEDSAVMELIKGGMRTVTGAVGGGNQQEYEVETPVASIGIRGTQYLLRLCQGDCGGDIPDGLYGNVSQGRIGVMNDAGERVFGGDRYFHVASANDLPRGMLTPPGDLFTGGPRKADGGSRSPGVNRIPDLAVFLSALAGSGRVLDREWEEPFESAEEPNGTGGVEGVFTLPAAGFAGFTNDPGASGTYGATGLAREADGDTAVAGSSGALIDLQGPNANASAPLTYSMSATGTPVELARDEQLGVSWGRWDEGDLDSSPALATNSDFHFAYSKNLTAQAHLDNLSGTATYSLAGSTTPTERGGATASFDTVRMQVDFNAQSIPSATVTVTKNVSTTITWTGSSSNLGPSFDVEVTETSLLGTGRLIGNFVGTQAEGALFIFKGDYNTEDYVGSGVLKR